MPQFAVAVIKADHNIMANLTIDPIDAFGLAASQAEALLGPFPGVQMIVAPEYFLNTRLAGNPAKPEVMSRKEKHSQYNTLEAISARLGHTILVAGTIFYKKGMFRKKGLNVCPVLQNGNIIYKYYKVYDDGALGTNDPDATYLSKNTSPIFTTSGITFGLEVCGDHIDATAQGRNWQGQTNSGGVDVHVIIADGGGVDLNRIQARHYCIFTDLAGGTIDVRHSATGAWQPTWQGGIATNSFTKVEPAAATTSQTTGAKIVVYDLPL